MQLDFIGTIKEKKAPIQFDLWTDNKPTKIKAEIDYDKVESFFSYNLNADTVKNYKTYWQSITPKNDAETFQRFIFSFLSVHSTYESNVRGYELLKDWTSWFNKWDVLEQKLIDSKVGLFRNRTKFIKEFAENYWKNPTVYQKAENETWVKYRNRIEKSTLGLGFAKSTFAIELIYPNEANLACCDVHVYRLFGLDQTRDSAHQETIEGYFVQMARLWNCPPAIARGIFWDKKQNKTDSRYWSYVLESSLTK